uniref:Bardet-Biedl syndrome 5 protein n=1 Tax=Parascaris equorum TaxID=6256 RepID=A0A914S3D9_PAREQ
MNLLADVTMVTNWHTARLLRLIAGEHLIERIDGVEDTKGNNGDKGVLRVTNIRLIWHATSTPRINLSIGTTGTTDDCQLATYNSINGVTTRLANSKIRGQAESLYLIARNSSTRFEFIFTCVNPTQTKLFTTVIAIHRAYETSKLYRELKMRGAVINEEEKLRVLPLEHQCDRFEGVWNLSSDQEPHPSSSIPTLAVHITYLETSSAGITNQFHLVVAYITQSKNLSQRFNL